MDKNMLYCYPSKRNDRKRYSMEPIIFNHVLVQIITRGLCNILRMAMTTHNNMQDMKLP